MILLKSVPYPRLLEKRKSIIMTTVTNMEKAVDAVTIMVMNIAMKIMNITMRMETVADAATIMVMKNMSTKNMRAMPTATMYRAIPRTVTVSCATPTRNTVTCAARV